MSLRAVVIGSGWAGDGHVHALRHAGVDVVALCGRTPQIVQERAQHWRIPQAEVDWKTALRTHAPDIVSIATPGILHRPVAEYAARQGCHVLCEKPLATSSDDARAMLSAVTEAGVAHAYAATGRYSPATSHVRRLIGEQAIGPVLEIECYDRWDFPANVPYSWVFSNAQGGGLLANSFTHKLAQVLHITGGRIVASSGTCTIKQDTMRVAPFVHDFRELFGPLNGWSPSQSHSRRMAEYDSAYTLTVELLMPQGHVVRALFREALGSQGPYEGKITVFGETGTLAFGPGHHDEAVRLFQKADEAWIDLPLPDDLASPYDVAVDPVQQSWFRLFEAFVGHIEGRSSATYPTFDDGVTAMEVIESAWYRRPWEASQERTVPSHAQ